MLIMCQKEKYKVLKVYRSQKITLYSSLQNQPNLAIKHIVNVYTLKQFFNTIYTCFHFLLSLTWK